MAGDEQLVLLDTSVVVHLLRGNQVGDTVTEKLALEERETTPLISYVTVGELQAFAEYRGWGDGRRKELHELVNELTVVPIERRPILEQYVTIDVWCTRNGRVLSKNDVWIAATAAAANALLVTNDKDFDPLAGLLIDRMYVDPHSLETTNSARSA